jgi:hypothetical protein
LLKSFLNGKPVADKQDEELSSVESGKVLQDPQPPRYQQQAIHYTKLAEQEGSTPSAEGDSLQRTKAPAGRRVL